MQVDEFIRDGYVVPSEDRANAGYHIEGSYRGPSGYWVKVRSRARGLLALFQPAVDVADEFTVDGSDTSPVAHAIAAGLATARE